MGGLKKQLSAVAGKVDNASDKDVADSGQVFIHSDARIERALAQRDVADVVE